MNSRRRVFDPRTISSEPIAVPVAWEPELATAHGRFCCESRKIESDKNRPESRRDETAPSNGVATRLGKSLVVCAVVFVDPHMFFRRMPVRS
jgi:hypothetical protein